MITLEDVEQAAERIKGRVLRTPMLPCHALSRLTGAEVVALEGGTDYWQAQGRPLVKDRTSPPDDACVDCYLRPYDRNAGIEEAMNAYLSWEIDLVHEIERDGTVAFGLPGETHAAA